MSRERRKDLIAQIQDKRGSTVIALVTSDRPGVSTPMRPDIVSVLHDHILGLNATNCPRLDLFIYSRGGQADLPGQIVSMFREYCRGKFSVLIPYRAHSAATVIAMGADEIVMTKKAELGPIDSTMTGPHNPEGEGPGGRRKLPVSVEDVMGYFSLLEMARCKGRKERMQAFHLISSQVHPLALGHVNRLLKETELVGFRVMRTRNEPYGRRLSRQITRKLSSEVYSHTHPISRTEARDYVGLKHVCDAEEVGIADELWLLYEEYKDFFELESPFRPEAHLIENNVDEHAWKDLKLACVESQARLSVLSREHRTRRTRQVPPTVNLNLQGLTFPSVTIPELPPGMDSDGINRVVSQIVKSTVDRVLNQAIHAAAERFLQAQPYGPFEHVSIGPEWNEVEES